MSKVQGQVVKLKLLNLVVKFSTTKALLPFKAAGTVPTWNKWVQSSLFL